MRLSKLHQFVATEFLTKLLIFIIDLRNKDFIRLSWVSKVSHHDDVELPDEC